MVVGLRSSIAQCRVGGLPRHGLEVYVEHSPERRHADADDEYVLHGNYSPAVKPSGLE